MYKMIVFDIDGTLLPYQKSSLSKKIKDMFKKLKERNFFVVLATGRDFVSVGNLNLYKNKYIDYFIGANGSFIYEIKTKKYIFNSTINFDDFDNYYKDILLTNQNYIYNVILSDDKNVYVWNKKQMDGHWFWEPFSSKFKDFDIAKENINYEKFHLITINCVEEGHLINKSKKYFKENDASIDIQSWWKNGYFVANKNITKASSIKKLCDYLNIKMENVIAFGDGENDIQMLDEVGLGIAMGNASDLVKSIANDVTTNVDELGTITYLEKMGII